jgi:hypothetical protein
MKIIHTLFAFRVIDQASNLASRKAKVRGMARKSNTRANTLNAIIPGEDSLLAAFCMVLWAELCNLEFNFSGPLHYFL